jgi:hypothetical protein
MIRKQSTIVCAWMLSAGLLASFAFASDLACGKPMTAEQKAQRAIDVQSIQNVMGYHQIYGAPGGDHDKEIELIWAHHTAGMSFAENQGIFKGDLDVIKRLYGTAASTWMNTGFSGPAGGTGKDAGNPSAGDSSAPPKPSGNFSFRTLTTPIIEVAGDGKTAKAWWYTIGWSSSAQGDKGTAQWGFERYGIDFVKEDYDWKIWHFHVYGDFSTPYEKNWVQNAIDNNSGGKGGESTVAQHPGLEQYYQPTVFHRMYDPKVDNNPADPPVPVPYCHFSETFSY